MLVIVLMTAVAVFIAGALLIVLSTRFGITKETQQDLVRLLATEVWIVLPVILSFWAGGFWLAAVLSLFAVRAVFELMNAQEGYSPSIIGALMGGTLTLLVPLVVQSGYVWLGCGLALGAPFVPWLGANRLGREMIIAQIMVGLALLSMQEIASRPNGSAVLIALYLTVETFDSFAAVIGKMWGKHRLFPHLSPFKTREGAMGGLIVTLPFASFALTQVMGVSYTIALAWVVLLLAAGFAGDMLTSWLKRFYGIKDFAPILVDHGGVLDVYDSFLIAVPFFMLVS